MFGQRDRVRLTEHCGLARQCGLVYMLAEIKLCCARSGSPPLAAHLAARGVGLLRLKSRVRFPVTATVLRWGRNARNTPAQWT